MKKLNKIITIVIMIAITASLMLTSACVKAEPQKHLKEDTTFYLDQLSIKLGKIDIDAMVYGALDLTKSYIKLRADGTFTLRLTLNRNRIIALNLLLKSLNTSEMDINSFADQYLYSFFPGFLLTDIPASLELLRKSLGASLLGIDFESPEMMALLNALAEGGLPDSLTLPPDLAIQLDSVYEIVPVHSDYTGDYTGIYVGNWDHEVSYEPYLIFTLYDNEEGQSCLKTRLEVLGADINATKG